MAFGRLERSAAAPPMSEINVTPLIDVMLVLLVIFIVSAPLLAQSLKLDLPAAAGAGPGGAPAAVAVSLDADGRLFWGDEPVGADELAARIVAAAARDPGTEVQLRADRRVPYGRVAELIGLVQQGGLSRIGFVTDADAGAGTAPDAPR